MKFTPKSETELTRFAALPDGDYPFTVLESAEQISKSAKNAGRPMVKLKLNVHGKEYDRHVYDYFADWFSEWKLKHFCETAGLVRQYEAGEIDPEGNALAGRQGFVRIKLVNDPQFGEKNEVDDYIAPKLKPLAETKAAPASKPKVAPSAPAQDRVDDVPF